MSGRRASRRTRGVIAHINSSWVTRVRRDDLVTFQVDGTHGSAVAGLSRAGQKDIDRCGEAVKHAQRPTALRPSSYRVHQLGDSQRSSAQVQLPLATEVVSLCIN